MHDVIHIPKSYLGFLFWHLWMTHPPRTLHRTNPCAKRKVLSLTKPKGKIYKMKSPGHYIIVRHHLLKRIGRNQSVQKKPRISIQPQFIQIHDLPLLEKHRKIVQAGCKRERYISATDPKGRAGWKKKYAVRSSLSRAPPNGRIWIKAEI